MTVFLEESLYACLKGDGMMRLYGIYKVKKMYEQFIIGREQLLYELLRENVNYESNQQEIHYLCDIIDLKSIDVVIMSKLSKVFDTVHYENGRYELTHSVKGKIIIIYSPYSLIVKCEGSRMLDLDLFVSLSETDRRFFAVMEGGSEWGWLKPVKHTQEKLERTVVFR